MMIKTLRPRFSVFFLFFLTFLFIARANAENFLQNIKENNATRWTLAASEQQVTANSEAFSSIEYVLEIIASTGQSVTGTSTIANLGWGPSINDSGHVAFTASIEDGREAIFIGDGDFLEERSLLANSFYYSLGSRVLDVNLHYLFGDVVQINNENEVVWRAKPRDGLLGFIIRQGPTNSDFKLVAKTHYPIRDSISPFQGPFIPGDAFFPWVTLSNKIDNSSRVVFSGIPRSEPLHTILATPVDTETGGHTDETDYHFSGFLMDYPNIYPMISDNILTVVKAGDDPEDDLIVFTDETLIPGQLVAAPPEFSAVGYRSGISDDGRLISFMGDHSTNGVGIYAKPGPNILIKIAGISGDGKLDPGEEWNDVNSNGQVDPGEDDGPFKLSQNISPFWLSNRVGVNRTSPETDTQYTIVYLANVALDVHGNPIPQGLYTSRVDISDLADPKISDPTLVIRVGDYIRELPGAITKIDLYDPVNNNGQIAFWVETDIGSKAIVRNCLDSDGDALCDSWEQEGIKDEEGNVILDLPAMGADPYTKDIFVEVDYMADGRHSHRPYKEAMDRVIEAFFEAPVDCDDGDPVNCKGIRLHIDYGQDTVMNPVEINPVLGETWGGLSKSNEIEHKVNFGSSDEIVCTSGGDAKIISAFKSVIGNPANFSDERKLAFHYALFVHNRCDGRSGGGTVPDANRFLGFFISLGRTPDSNKVGTVWEQTGTFMHELGHCLGLKHGGKDDVNYKPNYLSVMNYTFQNLGLTINRNHPYHPGASNPFAIEGYFDFSRFDSFSLPALDENGNLNEPIGFGSAPALAGYGTYYFCAPGLREAVDNVNDPIDWDCNNWIESNVTADINAGPSYIPNVIGARLIDAESIITRTLFQVGSINWQSSNDIPQDFVIDQTPKGMEKIRIGATIDLIVSSGPAGVTPDDSDGDGYLNTLDNCVNWYNPDQKDYDSDMVGDVCDNCRKLSNGGQEDYDNDGIGNACSFSKLESYNDWSNLDYTISLIGRMMSGDDLPVEPYMDELTPEEEAFWIKEYSVEIISPNSLSLRLGEFGTYEFILKNNGTNADVYSLTATSSLGWADLHDIAEDISLTGGEETSILINVSLPNDASIGDTDALTLSAMSQTNPLLMDKGKVLTIIDICEGDFDPDGDVDGADLIAYIADQTTISLADFAGDFGRTDCQSPD